MGATTSTLCTHSYVAKMEDIHKSVLFNFEEETNLKNHPVIVVGGGVMGSSITAYLASKGENVIMIDENHTERSSWGESRGLQHNYEGIQFS